MYIIASVDSDEQLNLYYKIEYGQYSAVTKTAKTYPSVGNVHNFNDIESEDFYRNLKSRDASFIVELYESDDFFGSDALAFKFEYDGYQLAEDIKRYGKIELKENVGKMKLLDFVVTIEAVRTAKFKSSSNQVGWFIILFPIIILSCCFMITKLYQLY